MPEPDPTSPFHHLLQLAVDYQEVIDLIESGMYDTEEVRELLSQRSILHDQIIQEFERLGRPVANREEAMQKACQLARWFNHSKE